MLRDKLFDIFYSVFLWVLWWLITMLYKNLQWKKFSLKMRAINMLLAGLVAWLVWEFLPDDMAFRDWLLGMSWVVSFQLVELFQTYWTKLIEKSTGMDKIKKDEKNPDEKI